MEAVMASALGALASHLPRTFPVQCGVPCSQPAQVYALLDSSCIYLWHC